MNVLVIDDHPLILSALKTVVTGLAENVFVTAAGSARAAREAMAADGADFGLILLDLHLGADSGFDLLAELRAGYPSVPVVIISASDYRADVVRAVDLGALGFVPKSMSNDSLLQALRVVISGGIYLPASIMRRPTEAQASAAQPGHGWSVSHGPLPVLDGEKASAAVANLGLTPRQSEVLALLLRGQSNKLIARALNLSVETIKDHVAAVLRSLNVSSRTQAVLAVSRMSNPGLLSNWRDPHRSMAP